jgi:hypothetical protein
VGLRFETRGSDSPWVDTVWTCASDQVAQMTSVAAVSWGLVFWERDGRAYAGVSGPETRTGTAPVPEGATFVGIEFAVGTSLRAVRRGHRPALSARTVERRFQAATGLTQGAVRQIERARKAAALLAAGVPVADVVFKLEYFDAPHLARALRRYVGRTARQLREGSGGAIALELDQPTS